MATAALQAMVLMMAVVAAVSHPEGGGHVVTMDGEHFLQIPKPRLIISHDGPAVAHKTPKIPLVQKHELYMQARSLRPAPSKPHHRPHIIVKYTPGHDAMPRPFHPRGPIKKFPSVKNFDQKPIKHVISSNPVKHFAPAPSPLYTSSVYQHDMVPIKGHMIDQGWIPIVGSKHHTPTKHKGHIVKYHELAKPVHDSHFAEPIRVSELPGLAPGSYLTPVSTLTPVREDQEVIISQDTPVADLPGLYHQVTFDGQRAAAMGAIPLLPNMPDAKHEVVYVPKDQLEHYLSNVRSHKKHNEEITVMNSEPVQMSTGIAEHGGPFDLSNMARSYSHRRDF